MDSKNVGTFKDKNLEKAVKTKINKPTGVLYKNNVQRITSLSSELIIRDISGIENLTNLTSLSLSQCLISDIRSLKGLTNLKMLNLGSNSISDDNIQMIKNALSNCKIYILTKSIF